ncbi:MAG: sugar phosphate isomerase/epimerase family protein [Oscillospiraceae bacterium]|nr:sugar phosphate isomerase/epimerase family protein [Oscillospiraceae bacterium]
MYQFQYGISCALEPQPQRQPVIIRGDIRHVAAEVRRAGYDAIELFLRDARQYDPKTLLAAAAEQGLSYCAISTGMEYNLNHLCLISDDAANRRAAIDALKAHLDLGAALGCPVVVGILRGNIPDFSRYQEYEDRLSAALTELGAYAAQAGTTIVVESILRYINNYLNSAPETADYLRRLGLPTVSLHIDTHSMQVEDKDLAESIRETADVLGYVHVSDSNRGYPGAGNIDFKQVMRALMEVGYRGYVSTECQPYPTEFECAQRGLQYIRHLVEILEIEQSEHRKGKTS